MQWRCSMDRNVNDKKYAASFDDWTWQLDSNVLVNRSYIRKFGLTAAEVTISMQEHDA